MDDFFTVLEEGLHKCKIALVKSLQNAELNEGKFLESIDIKIFRSNPSSRTTELIRVSERDHRHENLTDKEQSYGFVSTLQETSSTTVTTSSGHKISVGLSLSGGSSGASCGGDTGYQYSKSKNQQNEAGKSSSTTHQANGVVQPGQVVTIKEVTYQKIAMEECVVEFTIPHKAKVPYVLDDKESSIRISEIMVHIEPKHKVDCSYSSLYDEENLNKIREIDGELLMVTMSSYVKEETVEHSLQIVETGMTEERVQKCRPERDDHNSHKPEFQRLLGTTTKKKKTLKRLAKSGTAKRKTTINLKRRA